MICAAVRESEIGPQQPLESVRYSAAYKGQADVRDLI